MGHSDWNPIFYVVFIPILAGALYFVVCAIGGMCSKQAREAAAARRREAAESRAATEKAAERRRPTYTGPDFRRGGRSPGMTY